MPAFDHRPKSLLVDSVAFAPQELCLTSLLCYQFEGLPIMLFNF